MPTDKTYVQDRHSVILSLFGKSPEMRLIDLFLDNPLFEFTRNEMVESLGMAKSTLFRTIPKLESSGIIEETRKIGKASLYRLNGKSPIVENLKNIVKEYIIQKYSISNDDHDITSEKTRIPQFLDGPMALLEENPDKLLIATD